jgi:O-antigen ligase/tetratricopeptide (TPR) repeat protein
MGFSGSELRPLSLNPRQSLIEHCFNIGMLSLALLSAVVLSSTHRARRAAAVIFVCAAALAALGIAQRATGSTAIFWFFSSPEWDQPFATFINNNHGAVALAACAPFGLYFSFRSREQSEFLVWTLLTLLVAVGAAVSGSRSAVIILFSSCTAYLLAQSSRRAQRAGLFAAACAVLTVAMVGIEDSFQSLTLAVDPDFYLPHSLDTGRLDLYRASIPLLWSAPLIGAGAGAFSEAFKSRSLVEISSTVQQAHSDPIEIGIEYGLISLSVWSIIGLVVFARIAQSCQKNRDPRSRNLVAAYLACAFGIVLHSVWDFPFRIGAIAILFALTIGAGWGLTVHRSTTPHPRLTALTRAMASLLAVTSLILGGTALGQTRNPASFFGDSNHTLDRAKLAKESGKPEDAERLYHLALRQRPFEHKALLNLAELERQRGNPERAVQFLESAARIFPDYHYTWLNLARIDRAAGRSLQAARHYRTLLALRSPTKELAHAWLAEALSNHPAPHTVADIILPSRPERWCAAAGILTRELGKEAGEAMYKLAGEFDPDCDYMYAAKLQLWHRSQEALDLLSTLPENCRILRAKGLALLSLHRASDAVDAFEQADAQCTLDPYARYQMAIAQLENGNPKGLRILRQLVSDHDQAHVRRALLFRLEESGETQEAWEHLKILLQRKQIEPKDIDSKRFPRLHYAASTYKP